MFNSNPLDELALAHRHGDDRRAAAAAERLRDPAATRRILAASLRRAADLLDPTPLRRRPALGRVYRTGS